MVDPLDKASDGRPPVWPRAGHAPVTFPPVRPQSLPGVNELIRPNAGDLTVCQRVGVGYLGVQASDLMVCERVGVSYLGVQASELMVSRRSLPGS